MAVTASCPAYLTGLFLIGDKDAVGAGFSIDKSLATTVSDMKNGRTTITLNGQEGALPVSKTVLRHYTERGCRLGLLDNSAQNRHPSRLWARHERGRRAFSFPCAK